MILQADGVLHDSGRRDTLLGSEGADTFVLSHDGRADSVVGLQDGMDRIDLSSWDAVWEELSIRSLSPTEYVITYQGEEKLRISLAPSAPGADPLPHRPLEESDFIFREGLPETTPQMLLDQVDDSREIIVGTTRPDIFVFDDDGFRDTIRRFEPGKDLIDLANYGTSFAALDFTDRKPGRVAVHVPAGDSVDHLVVIDLDRQITAADFTADMFIF
ncbi:hypothetical protein HMH01_04070 [Halovulum dunhuangense]|uniref:Uncharacterized protein n=1 Tax=Halovulum dunhuangense TaxID=1505036 RepID=A0A849L093_9RHOB|nr:hypothetical protein [Halovulum dunhuangense]NNU79610.1 hypothetical protein [Halovulum dunhuangense]